MKHLQLFEEWSLLETLGSADLNRTKKEISDLMLTIEDPIKFDKKKGESQKFWKNLDSKTKKEIEDFCTKFKGAHTPIQCLPFKGTDSQEKVFWALCFGPKEAHEAPSAKQEYPDLAEAVIVVYIDTYVVVKGEHLIPSEMKEELVDMVEAIQLEEF
jgi:hypothetical protein